MSWRQEKTENGLDFVWDGVETGIGSSPSRGTANIQNANIATELGEVMASYNRVNEAQTTLSSQTLTPDDATLFSAPATLKAGTWIRVTSSSVTSITAATNPTTVTADYLVVGGGGGGGASSNGAAGGGGAGAVRSGTNAFSVGSTIVTVGAGGAGGTTFAGTTGDDSILGSVVTSLGGGKGGTGTSGTSPASTFDGGAGGSGGGGGADGSTSGIAGTAGTGGNIGGTGFASVTNASRAGGGGGGAGGAGTNASSGAGGAGGAGAASSITGTSVTYGGGGGGGAAGTAGNGGTGGGGAGGDNSAGSNGTDGLGGGGGGSSNTSGGFTVGGDGGDGIVIISYTTGSMVATGGTVTRTATNTVHTFTSNGVFKVVSIATGGLYYVSYKNASNKIKLSSKFDPTAANITTHGTTGSITFSTVAVPGSAIAKATEKYTTATGTEYRYYVMDSSGYVWYYDTKVYDDSLAASGVATLWMLPDPSNYSTLVFTGLAILNGWVMVVSNSTIYSKPVVDLGRQFSQMPNVWLNEPFPTHNNFAYVGKQGKMYYCDGNYIGEIFPTTSLITSVANIQSNCSYTIASGTTTTIEISAIINGSLPYDPSASTRIPVIFYTNQYGTLPTAVTEGTVYYLSNNIASSTFTVRTAITGGSTVDISTGASGTQYFNTFYPTGSASGVSGTSSTVQFSSQRLNLPQFETTQCMVELGNTIIVGCNGTTLYPWNQVDALPSDFIELPEANTKVLINVNNTAYAFAGNKGNIYVTNGTSAAVTLKVPDYCAGVPGTPLTYIEPYFTWGDASYLRGRVYFSILDQTATKAGNTGGIWSFVPSENVTAGQEIGLAVRLENQQSYGDYDGVATIIIPNEEQLAVSPQYWTAWQDSYSTGTSTFGIDNTGTVPVTTFVVETDFLQTGTLLAQKTLSQAEYNLTTQLATGDSIQLSYRTNATDAWASCGTVKEETTNRISGYFNANFQKTQMVQIRMVATTVGTTASSFVRLKSIRLR